MIESSHCNKKRRGKLAANCRPCRDAKNSKRLKMSKECKRITLEAFFDEIAKDSLSEGRYLPL